MKKFRGIVAGVLVCLLTLVGCNKSDNKVSIENIIGSSDQGNEEDNQENVNPEEFTLTMLNTSVDESYLKQVFNELYPKAKLNVITYAGYDLQKTKETIKGTDNADVIMYYSSYAGVYNTTDIFEDLSQSQYTANEVKTLINENELGKCMSYDGKKLLAFPLIPGTMVTYYRADILEQHGITSDPEQLAKLMETSDGWLSIAKALRKDNIKIIQWRDELAKIAIDEYGYYDKDMNLSIYNEKLKNVLKLVKEIYDEDLTSEKDIWGDAGKKAIREGTIAMTYMNRWGEENLKDFAPQTSGKWRTTRLPLGINSESGTNNISISSKSKYKLQAWNFLKTLIVKDRSHYQAITNEPSEFLGGQQSKKLYDDLATKLPRKYPTLLDEKAANKFVEQINTYAHTSDNIDELLNSIKTKIDEETSSERKILTDYINENN